MPSMSVGRLFDFALSFFTFPLKGSAIRANLLDSCRFRLLSRYFGLGLTPDVMIEVAVSSGRAIAYATALLPFFYLRTGIIDPWFNLFMFTGIALSIFYLDPDRRNRDRVDPPRPRPIVRDHDHRTPVRQAARQATS